MKRQVIWKTSVITTREAEDAVTELLAKLVAPSPSVYTDADTGTTTVSVYSITGPASVAQTKRILRLGLNNIKSCGLNIGPSRITIQKLPPENWADSWKRHFPPLEIGEALLVKPSWSKRQRRKGQALVVLDPGLSFGTGQHPTTEFCLRELVRAERGRLPSAAQGRQSRLYKFQPADSSARATTGNRSRSFLDMGTGSGILAISAVKLGYAPVHAFDFDPQSVRVAKANATTNRIGRKILLTRADLTQLPRRRAKQYDVVCANLLADLLIAERDRILARVKPDGVLVVAGILKREFQEVQTAYETVGWRLAASKTQKEWRSGTFARRGV
jgi:ribosomal protein L11 methyltransferase